MQYAITCIYEVYDYDNRFKSLFKRMSLENRQDQDQVPWFTTTDVGNAS